MLYLNNKYRVEYVVTKYANILFQFRIVTSDTFRVICGRQMDD